jgi:hypothetical protein
MVYGANSVFLCDRKGRNMRENRPYMFDFAI